MFSSVQNTLSNIVGPSGEHIANAIISPFSTIIAYRHDSSPHTILQQCLHKLEYLQVVLDGISDERRRKIETAAQRRTCKHLRDIEFELDRYVLLNFISTFRFLTWSEVRLFEEYHSLCRLYRESHFYGRFPGTMLHRDISQLEDIIMVFFEDHWVSVLRLDTRIIVPHSSPDNDTTWRSVDQLERHPQIIR